jgi:hypothetical protein
MCRNGYSLPSRHSAAFKGRKNNNGKNKIPKRAITGWREVPRRVIFGTRFIKGFFGGLINEQGNIYYI